MLYMKRIIIYAICIGFLCCGCHNNEKNNVSIIENEIIDIEENNPFFCVEEDMSFAFHGQVFFDSFGDIPIPKCKTAINFEKIAKLKLGNLYHLTIDAISGLKIPNERLSIGYFYVQKDKIIRLWESDDNIWSLSSETLEKLISSDIVPSRSVIVCQENEIKDSSEENQNGWHQYLVIDGNRREFHMYYKHPQSIGYWESFTWEKEVGLISYKSGYKDGINYFELNRR